MASLISTGGASTPLYGLYRYVRPQRVWILAVLVRNTIWILAILASSQAWFLHFSLELGDFLENAILLNKSI